MSLTCWQRCILDRTIASDRKAGLEDLQPIVEQAQPMGANCWQWRKFVDADALTCSRLGSQLPMFKLRGREVTWLLAESGLADDLHAAESMTFRFLCCAPEEYCIKGWCMSECMSGACQ
jgi:hypothetical protein